MKKLFSILCIICIALSFSSCKNKIKEIILSSDSIEMQVGETKTIQYAIVPESEEELTFKSVDETIVKIINGSNRIEGIKAGETTIIISSENGVTATCKVQVIEQPLSAYERLSEDERDFVDCVLEHIDTFKNPDSVVIKEIEKGGVQGSIDWSISLNAMNGFGAITNEIYYLGKIDGFWKPIIDTEIYYPDENYNLDLINEAINDMR